VLERSFGGSLPKFIAAFLGGDKISPEVAEEIKRMLDEYRGNA
jgi:predicted transcriptional regulator